RPSSKNLLAKGLSAIELFIPNTSSSLRRQSLVMLAGAVFPWRGDNSFRLLIDGPEYFASMLKAIEAAERRVDLELYLVEDGECLEQMTQALENAAQRGVRVRCLFDGFGCLKMGQASRERLAAAGVELRVY